MATTITAGNATNGAAISSDSTGILELKSGTGSGTTAVTIGTNQAVTFAGAVTSSGNQTVTGNLTVDGNTTLGNANTDTILMTAAPSIGGAGLGMGFGFRNRIINGAMVIDQRNAGASVSLDNSNKYITDRFNSRVATGSGSTAIQSSVAPAGFTRSLLITIGTGASPAADALNWITQVIEGFNSADLGWGTANAQAITVSFWVRSSVTGTYAVAVTNGSLNRSYVTTYTVSAANTWEQKTVTIPGDTSGTWATDNTSGIYLFFDLGSGSTRQGTAGSWSGSWLMATSGSVKLVATSGATFYITGVQLEKGSTATSFDYRPYTTELQLCQRYYIKTTVSGAASVFGSGFCSGATTALYYTGFPTTMRTIPTALEQSGTASDYRVRFTTTAATCSSVPVFSTATNISASYQFTVASGLTAGQGTTAESNSANAYLAWSAEL